MYSSSFMVTNWVKWVCLVIGKICWTTQMIPWISQDQWCHWSQQRNQIKILSTHLSDINLHVHITNTIIRHGIYIGLTCLEVFSWKRKISLSQGWAPPNLITQNKAHKYFLDILKTTM